MIRPGSRLARLTHVAVTTVAQDAERTAPLAVEAVVERLESEAIVPPRDVLLKPRLVVRDTTGPAPTHDVQPATPV